MNKKKNSGEKTKNVILTIAIAIIFALFVGFGISVFYPSPNWNDFCSNDVKEPVATQAGCESVDGEWETFEEKPTPSDNQQITCTKLEAQETERFGVPENENSQSKNENYFTLRCNNLVKTQANGYCDQDSKCREEYNNQREGYDKIVFIITLIIGIITILGAVALKLASVSVGLMAGGMITIIYGVLRYWEHSTDVLRFIILGIVLGLLIWLGYRKLK